MGEGSGAVPQIVQPYRRQPGAVGELPEPGGGVVRVDRLAVLAGEHVPGFVPLSVGGVPAVAALELPAVVLTQDRDGVLVQGDGPAAGGGLRVALDDLVTGGGALPFDEQQSAVEVDGCLFESAELAADEARKDELVGARDHGDAGLSSAESQLLDAALRDDARERDRVLARNPADGWSMELLSAAFVLVARRWWDERWDRRVIHAFARRFVEQAPGGSGLVVRDVEAMVRAATGELSLAASLADAQKLPELPYALLLALADDLDMRDAEVGPLLAEAAREATAALSMVEPLEGAVNGPVALRRYRRIHRRYLTDDDVVLSRPEPPRQPRPVAAVRGGGGHAGPTTRAGRFLRSYLLGVDGPAAGEVSEADRFRIMRTTLSEALWLYLPEDPDLREISTLVHLARTAYPQDVDPMKAEYAIRLIMGENVSLDGMKKSDIYRASAALLQVIAEWWQHDETVLTELIEDAERTLTRQGTVLAG